MENTWNEIMWADCCLEQAQAVIAAYALLKEKDPEYQSGLQKCACVLLKCATQSVESAIKILADSIAQEGET